jgi:ribosomal protein S18 acetylase RimI-like enzyme
MSAYALAEFTAADYDAAVALWRESEGVGLSSADSRERVQRYLLRNAGLSFVAHADGTLIGAVLCGHDGRRGYLHHLAVRRNWRGLGVGSALATACLAALERESIDKCHIFVYAENQAGQAFWSHLGWKARPDLGIMSKDI